MTKLLINILALIILFTTVATAETENIPTDVKSFPTEEFSLSESQMEEIKKIDQQYNQFLVVKSKFLQKDSSGNTAKGWFIIERPGKLRVEYENIPIRFIASNNSLLYQDIKLKQKSFIPIKSTPFHYLMATNTSFLSKEVMIVNYQILEEYTEITFVNRENPALGSLTLFLSNDNSQIIKWNVFDSKGILTEVFLNNPEFSNNKIKNSSIFNVQKVKEVTFAEIE